MLAAQVMSHCELHQFIAALGIPLIGSTASKELATRTLLFIHSKHNSFHPLTPKSQFIFSLPTLRGSHKSVLYAYEYASVL